MRLSEAFAGTDLISYVGSISFKLISKLRDLKWSVICFFSHIPTSGSLIFPLASVPDFLISSSSKSGAAPSATTITLKLRR